MCIIYVLIIKRIQIIKKICKIYEKTHNNASVWNTPRGNQDVSFGEGVSKIDWRIRSGVGW